MLNKNLSEKEKKRIIKEALEIDDKNLLHCSPVEPFQKYLKNMGKKQNHNNSILS